MADTPEVHRVSINGGLRIGSDGSYSSEGYSLARVHGACADALVAMDYKRNVILAFRKAHGYPRSVAAEGVKESRG